MMLGRLFRAVRTLGERRRMRQAVERSALRVHELAARGLAPVEIARQTGLSVDAVATHLATPLNGRQARQVRGVQPRLESDAVMPRGSREDALAPGLTSGERQIFDSQQRSRGPVADKYRRHQPTPVWVPAITRDRRSER